MLSAGVWKLKELTDKVTNVVMNYSEVETKVREATNEEAWGPHGTLMKEIAQYTYTYEHFPEVMGMLWKRMLHDNKKCWRRVYKSLVLLAYLIRNGSERVVTSTREHIYDLRGLENYSFTDEMGKDQGLNVRHKCKDLLEFIQDDDRLREERKKAKKNKEKYVGVSNDDMGMGGGGGGGGRDSYSDRYDEEPSSRRERSDRSERSDKSGMEEIGDWQDGKKNVVTEAMDKAKDLWNKAQGRQGPDDKYEFKDNDEEFTSIERSHTTKTEKITTNRRSRSGPQKIDLGGASAALGGRKTESQVNNAQDLFDLGQPASSSPTQEGFADFSNFQAASSGGDDFNPRASANSGGEFGDFAAFGSTSVKSNSSSGFADFSQFSSSTTTTLPSPAGAPTPTAVPASSSAASDLFDVFNSPNANPIQPSMQSQSMMTPNNNMIGSGVNMMGSGVNPMMAGNPTSPQGMGNMGMMNNNMSGMGQMGMMPNMGMGGMMPGMMPMNNMGQQSMMMPGQPPMMSMGSGVNPNMQNNTWSDATSKVNISLDGLSPAAKMKQSNMPAMNQMGSGVPMMSPVMPQGVVGLSQGISNMGLQSPTGAPVMGMPGMGSGPQPMMNNMGNMGMNPGMNQMNQGQMMAPGMGMQMTMSNNMTANATFQNRTDSAFSAFGKLK